MNVHSDEEKELSFRNVIEMKETNPLSDTAGATPPLAIGSPPPGSRERTPIPQDAAAISVAAAITSVAEPPPDGLWDPPVDNVDALLADINAPAPLSLQRLDTPPPGDVGPQPQDAVNMSEGGQHLQRRFGCDDETTVVTKLFVTAQGVKEVRRARPRVYGTGAHRVLHADVPFVVNTAEAELASGDEDDTATTQSPTLRRKTPKKRRMTIKKRGRAASMSTLAALATQSGNESALMWE